ncbi:MAG: sigma-70 family RNA polymerase sigma factor [Dehalococcoidia bacterium]|nr:sigma-70 family RNA polymerase sigma factor [Dehalococcoidia bacterium]MSQ16261.1 sigma-70 family RNA polymerase sigma factor [Dehalococcoidia bacterium]
MTTSPQTFSCANHVPLPVKNRAGDNFCYNCIIESFQSPAYNLARRLLGDWSLAEDAVQEGFVSGYRAFAQFRGGNLKAWVMRIVANNCRDMLRSRRARPTVSLDPVNSDDPDDPTPSAVDIPSKDESPEDHAQRSELRRALDAGLNSLPQEQKMALLLVDVQGFSYEEAAQTMSCSLGTVKSRVSRGRSGMRDFLRTTGELLPSQFRQDR